MDRLRALRDPRVAITADPTSHIRVVESHVSAADALHFSSAVTEIAAAPDATVDHAQLIDIGDAVVHVGTVLIHQKMFESRLFFVDKLIDMGAKIILCDPHRATVIGHDFKSTLKATTMTSPDIRAGVSLLIAALSAKGTSVIHNIEQIDRGYENIDERLRAIGAKIERLEGN